MKWKTFRVMWVPGILFAIQSLNNKTVLELFGVDISKSTGKETVLGITIGTITLFAVNHLTSNSRFFKKFKHSELRKWRTIDEKTAQFIEGFRGRKDLSVNVMLLSGKKVCIKEPRKRKPDRLKPSVARILKPVYHSVNSVSSGKRNLVFTVNQGVCGQVVREENTIFFDLASQDPAKYNLNSEQVRRTEDLQSVISTPLWEYDFTTDRSSQKVIGVVNVDCTSDYLRTLVANNKDWLDLKEKVETLSYSISQVI